MEISSRISATHTDMMGIGGRKEVKEKLKETSTEMLAEMKLPGEFKDKKGLDEIKDMKIGPDIRYALRSKNLNFLRRIIWGPLTVAEFREVKHRIRELEMQLAESDKRRAESVHERLPQLDLGSQVEVAA
ncbi:MAG: hypothetical protein JRH18_03825 [Deltaproteobacteria bacterium]|nr:hypothetical protein [Deltaproteobacteria bacterium]MBW1961610.1 hypothetical protein [Deltaproteobacteria bacterium]MBW2150778.1 hypothetical protein [Deltaproteobacteria bacterium]